MLLVALLAASAFKSVGSKTMLLNRNRSPPPSPLKSATGSQLRAAAMPPAGAGKMAANARGKSKDQAPLGPDIAEHYKPVVQKPPTQAATRGQSSDPREMKSVRAAKKAPTKQYECTMDEYTLATITEEEFRSQYYLKRPVVIRQAVSGNWAEAFSREALQHDPERNMHVIAMQMIGDSIKSRCDGVKPVNLTLGTFLQKMTVPPALAPSGKNAMTTAPWQIFDHNALSTGPGQSLDRIVRKALPQWMYTPAMRAALSVGGKDAGTQFHKHSDGFSLLFVGHKRWWMTPHESMPVPTFPADKIPIKVWADELFPSLDLTDKPSHCVQAPGDIIYVPDGFYHATVNLDDTIGIAAQNLDGGPIQEKVTQQVQLVQASSLQELARAKLCASLSECSLIAAQAFYDSQPKNNAGPWALATALKDNGRSSQANLMAEESIRRNPKHADSYTKLANFLLLDILEPLVRKQSNFNDFPPAQDAETKRKIIELLQKAHKLNPLDFQAQDSLVVVYEVSGDGAARHTRHWEQVRDQPLNTLDLGSTCLLTQTTMFSVAFAGYLQGRGDWLPAIL